MGTADFAVLINGTYGVGKSATLDHIGDLMAEAGRPFSLMDVDWFHRSWPPADTDPRNVLTEAANMAAVWRNYRATGRRRLIVAGVMASEADRERYATALGLEIRSVRLEASEAVTRGRLERRYGTARPSALDWHLDGFGRLASTLSSAGLDEAVIDTTAVAPPAVAENICRVFHLR